MQCLRFPGFSYHHIFQSCLFVAFQSSESRGDFLRVSEQPQWKMIGLFIAGDAGAAESCSEFIPQNVGPLQRFLLS